MGSSRRKCVPPPHPHQHTCAQAQQRRLAASSGHCGNRPSFHRAAAPGHHCYRQLLPGRDSPAALPAAPRHKASSCTAMHGIRAAQSAPTPTCWRREVHKHPSAVAAAAAAAAAPAAKAMLVMVEVLAAPARARPLTRMICRWCRAVRRGMTYTSQSAQAASGRSGERRMSRRHGDGCARAGSCAPCSLAICAAMSTAS